MAIYALIGGKVNREKVNNHIEEKLLSLTHKKTPIVLFCPFAVLDEEKSISKFHHMMEGLDCKIIDIYKKDISKFDEYLNQADILYIGGGVSDDLIRIFESYHLKEILLQYEKTNKIYAGSSAGAMLFTVISMGDKDMFVDNFHTYNYKMVHGLALLNISMCPHYQNEDLILYNDEIKKYGLLSFGIEEDTCLLIDGSSYSVIKDDLRMSLYQFHPKNDYIMKPLYEGEVYEDSSIRS